VVTGAPSLARAYAYCEQRARTHYENFPVASRLLPPRMRPHIAAIYAFARAADDFADEPGIAAAERLRRLDDWRRRLFAAPPSESDPVFLALANTIREYRLPLSLFEDLLSAFTQDVTTGRYADWEEVLDYCRRSANPVGRLVLRVAGYDDPRLDRWSDAVCTALQLTNFWQDLERDWAIGRVYVPAEDRRTAGAREEDLERRQMTAEWRRVMALMVHRTRDLFDEGRPVCNGVRGRLRWELRLTWLGGSKILDKLEHAHFDVFHHRPSLGPRDVPGLLRDAVLWRHGPRTTGTTDNTDNTDDTDNRDHGKHGQHG
jgi:phytoene synthase